MLLLGLLPQRRELRVQEDEGILCKWLLVKGNTIALVVIALVKDGVKIFVAVLLD